jgi:diguanylate cyclase (GGDEF)-like protein
VDPLTLAVGAGAVAVTSLGTGLRLRRRLRVAEATAAGLQRELEAERHAANHDSLTGLLNRRAFYQQGHRLVADPAQPAIACVVVDLNSFKQINDELGHSAGDEVLITVARRLARYGGRGAAGNLVARLGGDEFAGLFRHPATDWALLYPAADDLADLLAAPMTVAGRPLLVTASVGVAAITRDGGLTTALAHADCAMYRAKATGTRAACFNPVLDRTANAGPRRGGGADSDPRRVVRGLRRPETGPAPLRGGTREPGVQPAHAGVQPGLRAGGRGNPHHRGKAVAYRPLVDATRDRVRS